MFKKMFGLLLGATIIVILLASCQKSEKIKTAEKIKLHVVYDNETKLQLSVENGYQIWRLNPIDVAHGALTDSHEMADYNACKIEKMDERHAVVTTNYKETTYKVHLSRVVKPNGIWTATEIEKLQ
ncbi:MAG: hypothetical protein HZA05_04890 [Nitrospirae bacterium]|nr:hypothetical protein [Nitrospirota bacterium]